MTLDVRALFRGWLPLAAAITGICLLVYATVQQSFRTGANDPQVQLVEDAISQLAFGTRPESLRAIVASPSVDMEQSLATFVIVYNDLGTVLVGTGMLGGRVPVPPAGVFAFAREHGEERVSWQPTRRARIAAVVRHSTAGSGAFVLAGRSLREVEARELSLRTTCGLAWIVLLTATLALAAAGELLLPRRR
jgi:hypothetical protein